MLNRAARVMATGHGGQILVADRTAGLLSGVDLVILGPRRLRDVPSPITVFQVKASGLREEFPPLRGVELNPGECATRDHMPDRARHRGLRCPSGGAFTSVGDIDRRGWRWQDPDLPWKSPPGSLINSRTEYGFSSCPQSLILPRCPTRLRDQTYESLASQGEAMTTATMAAYAYDQIDQARAERNAASSK